MSIAPSFGDIAKDIKGLLHGGFVESVRMELASGLSHSTDGAQVRVSTEQTDAGLEGALEGRFTTARGMHVTVRKSTREETSGEVCMELAAPQTAPQTAPQLTAPPLVHTVFASARAGAKEVEQAEVGVHAHSSALSYRAVARVDAERTLHGAASGAVRYGRVVVGVDVGGALASPNASRALGCTHAEVAATYTARDVVCSLQLLDFGRVSRVGFVQELATPGALLGAEIEHVAANGAAASHELAHGSNPTLLAVAAQIPIPRAEKELPADALKVRADTTGLVQIAYTANLHPHATLTLGSSIHTARLHDPTAHKTGAALHLRF
eukprot:TRINITY_DN76_c0_g5_i1.p1 TRINITY_DN76_c0_g5~~TRINITY_DN76_c0_g5_i1.p1  ORF type:complete len:324 (-),score=40.13 TRINITY_DN76_c0_g5_i1:287-1258(-)